MTRKHRLSPRRVSGVAFLFTVCWMAAAGVWLLYGEPVFGKGRGEPLPSAALADSNASTNTPSARQMFARVRVADGVDAGAQNDRGVVSENSPAPERPEHQIEQADAADGGAPKPRFTVSFSSSDYVGLELTPIWGEGEAAASAFQIQHVSPQSALHGHLCTGDVLVSHQWIENPAVTGREAERALEKAIYGRAQVPLTIRPVGVDRDTEVELVIVAADGGKDAGRSNRFQAGLGCSGERYSANAGKSFSRTAQSSL